MTQETNEHIADQAYKTLEKKVILLSSLLESATEHSIISTDLNTLILTWNEGAHRIFGYEENEIVGIKKFLFFRICLMRNP